MSRESVSLTDAAKLLDVSRQTIWRLAKAGKLEVFTVLRCKRILISELRRYKQAHTVDVSGRFTA